MCVWLHKSAYTLVNMFTCCGLTDGGVCRSNSAGKGQDAGQTGTCPIMDAYTLAPRSLQTKTAVSLVS